MSALGRDHSDGRDDRIDPLEFRSQDHSPREAFDAYHELYRLGTDVSRAEGEFHASVAARKYPRMVVIDRTLAGLSHERTARRVDSDGFDHVMLQSVVSGTLGVVAGGTSRLVGPGHIVSFDLLQPQRTLTSGSRIITVSIAREIVERTCPSLDGIHGRVFAPGEANLIQDLMRSLSGNDVAPGSILAQAATSSMGAFIGSLLGVDDTMAAAVVADNTKTKAAMELILANMRKSDLSPDTIARGVGVSRSVLYRLFEPYGGVAHYTKRQRLLALRKSLSASSETRPFSALAAICGFAGEAHANRSFRDAFGQTPGEFRRGKQRTTDRLFGVDDGFSPMYNDLI